MPDQNLLAGAEQYFRWEIAQFEVRNREIRAEISKVKAEISKFEKLIFPWWRLDKKIAISQKRAYHHGLRVDIRQNEAFLDDCRVALNNLSQGLYKPVIDVLKRLNKYWRGYFLDNLGINSETLAAVVIICPPLARSLMPETLWHRGQVIRQELKLQCLN